MSRATSISARLFACALTGAAALAAAPGAFAAAPIKAAQFDVTVRGTQVSIWDYSRAAVPPCMTGNQDYGDQTITFGTPGPARVTVAAGGGLERPTFSLVDLVATAERGATLITTGEVSRTCPVAGSGGGDDPSAPTPDCRKLSGTLQLYMHYGVGGPSRFGVVGYEPIFGGNPLGLGSAYADCPFALGVIPGPEADGEILPIDVRLPQRKLFNPRRKRIVFHLGRITRAPNGEGSEKTITTYNIVMKRVAAPKG